MNREKLLDEVWREDIRDDILSCVIMREKKSLSKECETECESYPICKRVFELENETR